MKYMLDTNICIYIMKKKPVQVVEKFLSLKPSERCISAIVLAELEFGICKSSNPRKNSTALEIFLEDMEILPFDAAAAIEYGDIKATLERRGTPIGANDMLIAAHARSLGIPLITNNSREFERVDDLQVENWS